MYCNNCGKQLVGNGDFCDDCGTKIKKRKCCVCNSDNLGENATILFITEQGEYRELCSNCETNMNLLVDYKNETNIEKAIHYFTAFLNRIDDFEVRKNVSEMISEGNNYLWGERQEKKNKEISGQKDTDKDLTIRGDFWIKGLRLVMWLVFFAIIIAGIALGAGIGSIEGFLIFLLSIPISFLTVAMMMVWLDVAQDIKIIRNELLKKL